MINSTFAQQETVNGFDKAILHEISLKVTLLVGCGNPCWQKPKELISELKLAIGSLSDHVSWQDVIPASEYWVSQLCEYIWKHGCLKPAQVPDTYSEITILLNRFESQIYFNYEC